MSDFLYYLAAFALILGILIIVHEYGHYLVARWAGVKVLRFSVGFGRPVFLKRFGRDGTEWALGVFPLGGYVKMLDERECDVLPEEMHRSFNQQSVWRRMGIVAAGPVANLVLAIFVYWGIFWHGTEELKPILGTPVAASPAASAGFENGEHVRKVGGQLVQTWQDMRWVLIRTAVYQDVVDVEVINSQSEITIRHLDVSLARANGWEGDALEKLGVRFYRPMILPILGKIDPDSPAAAVGLHSGDEILRINEVFITTWADVVSSVRNSPGKELAVELNRNGERFVVEITPARVAEHGREIGRIGAFVRDAGPSRSDLMVTVSYGPLPALVQAVEETWDKSVFSLVMIGKMLTGEVSWRNISGPVTIADYAGQSARLGLGYYLKFLALVSVSLAVLNLLPIPILDGGHLLYYVIEIIKRQPLSESSMELGQKIGLAVMFMLMASAVYNDINRLISG